MTNKEEYNDMVNKYQHTHEEDYNRINEWYHTHGK